MEEAQRHAIVFAWPGQGHLNPLLRFSDLLAMEGCKVTFAHSHYNLDRLRKAAAAFRQQPELPPEDGPAVEFVGIDDGIPEGQPRDIASLIDATDARGRGGLVASFDSLVARLLREAQNTEPFPIFFIVSDFFMAFTQDVANKYCLPRIAVFVQPAASFACHFAVAGGFRPLPGAKFLDCLPGVLPAKTHPTDMISFLQCYDPLDPLFDYMIRSFKRTSEPTWILLNTFDELEHDLIEYLKSSDVNIQHLECCGPLVPLSAFGKGHSSSKHSNESLCKADDTCLKWLDTQKRSSVLFVSFGTLVTLSARQAEEIASALEKSMVSFVWVIREGLIENGNLPNGFVERVKERACFPSWVSQIKVLSHPAVGGFLSHCGWNSVQESIVAGVPLLGWPSFADQALICRCISDSWGIGFSFFMYEDCDENGVIKSSIVEEKIRRLMLELPSSIERRCVSVREAACKAADTVRSRLILILKSMEHGSITK